MGKAKKRGFTRGIGSEFPTMSRQEATEIAVKYMEIKPEKAENLITLFGLSAEELLENGASYEAVKVFEKIIG